MQLEDMKLSPGNSRGKRYTYLNNRRHQLVRAGGRPRRKKILECDDRRKSAVVKHTLDPFRNEFSP